MNIKIISGNVIRQSVDMTEAIDAVKEAYIQLSQGEAVLPQRIQLPVKKQKAISLFMPAYLSKSDSLGVKIVSVFPENSRFDLPTIHALVAILDAKTGRPQAILDGAYLTALRTGAASGVATDLLARKGARSVAIFGAGIQGRTQLEAVCAVRPIEKVWVYDRDPEKSQAYVEELGGKERSFPSDLFIAQSPAHAAQEADIICTATTSFDPVFDDADLKPGVHINGVGSYTPEMQEIPSQTVIRAKIIVDSLSACLEEAGDLITPLNEGLLKKKNIYGEIGQVASGQICGRESDDELTFFKSVGLAIQDVAVAELALRKAQELALEEEVEL